MSQSSGFRPPDNIGRFGDSPVRAVVGPGTQAVSLSVYRSFRYKERYALRIGASAANIFNHPNYGVPNFSLGTAPLGTITSLQSPPGSRIRSSVSCPSNGLNSGDECEPERKPNPRFLQKIADRRSQLDVLNLRDVRCVMQLLLPLVALCALASAPLRADMFDITLTGNPGSPSGSGTFSTDGTCSLCEPGTGLLSLTVNIGPNSGTDAFDISDDALGTLTLYKRPTNTLAYQGTNSETNDSLDMELHIWFLTQAGSTIGTGTYSVTPAAPVPEPSYLFPLMLIAALVGLDWRHHSLESRGIRR